MKNQIVVPVGYMGSGSSAITDIISEIDGYINKNGSFEFVFMHCPDGLFDLEDKLLIGNNSLRSDEAIHKFQKCMDMLYSTRGYWISGYNKRVSEDFDKYCTEFVESIISVKYNDAFWYYQQNPVTGYMKLHYLMRRSHIFPKQIIKKLPKPLIYREMVVSYVSKEFFYDAAQKWLANIWNALGWGMGNIVVDQLLLPHNLIRIDNYFGEELRAIIVDRDPRDVFVLNKYFWSIKHEQVPYPNDVEGFCEVFRKIRETEEKVEDTRILRIHFEDLIYRYEDSLKRIYNFLNIDEQKHTKKRIRFQPEKSINNTQVFRFSEDYKRESEYIERELQEYLYEFPYKLETRNREVF